MPGTVSLSLDNTELSQFAKDFFETQLGEDDIANLIGADANEKSEQYPTHSNAATNQNSETSSMYSVEGTHCF